MRRLAGLLAVLALLFSQGEAIASSSCAMMASRAMEMAPEASVQMLPSADCDAPERNGQRPCPFSALMGPGCTGAASARALAPQIPDVATGTFAGLTPIVTWPPSRPSDGLFHPPKA